MEYRNLSNFILSLLLIYFLITFVTFVNRIITVLAVTFFSIKLAEWLTEVTRKYFLYKQVSPKNKVILITGCDTGFGNALARRMDKLGYSVLATCLDPDGEGPRKLSQDCSGKLTVLPMDVTDEQSVQKVKEFVENNVERKALWAVVNNAGTMQCGQVDWSPVEEFQRACDINAFGALRVTKAFLPFIKESKGRIVNVTSSAGRYMIPGFSAYCLSKSAAVALTTSLQMELPKWGIKCISIEPYLFSTALVGEGLFAVAKKTWNAAPTEMKEEYGRDYFEAFRTIIDRVIFIFASSNISQVIDSMVDAITAEDPLLVYIPASLFLRTLVLLYRALPLGMKEYLAGCILDIAGKPLALQIKEKRR